MAFEECGRQKSPGVGIVWLVWTPSNHE